MIVPFSRANADGVTLDGVFQLVHNYRVLIAVPFVHFAAFDVFPVLASVRYHQLVLLGPLRTAVASLRLYLCDELLLPTDMNLDPLVRVTVPRAPAVSTLITDSEIKSSPIDVAFRVKAGRSGETVANLYGSNSFGRHIFRRKLIYNKTSV